MSGQASASPTSAWAWIGLGCNVGHRGTALGCLRNRLGSDGVEIAAASPEILTRPVGITGQPDFHNQVLLLRHDSALAAADWLRRCKDAEAACGRRDTYRWGPRRADADIVLLGRDGEVSSRGEPTVPHPQLRHRWFWRRLISEIDPDLAAGISP